MTQEELQYYLNNREIIKNLGLNTGTSSAPDFSNICTLSEIAFNVDWEQKDWYVACDAIKRALLTGAGLTLKTTVKIDMNNKAVKMPLKGLHSMLETGEIAQFNNQIVQFDLLDDVADGVLSYKTYQVQAMLKFSDLGGPVEDEGSYSLEIVINGKGKLITK